MKEQVEQVIQSMLNGEGETEEAVLLLQRLRENVRETPSLGKTYGLLIAQLGQAIRSRPEKADINLVPVANGFLAIGHKPGGKISFAGMKAAGISVILTLLHENEGAKQIGMATSNAGMLWIPFPFSASKPHEGQDKELVKALYEELRKLLKEGQGIYIHCSAGIHRTGMISYGLLRYLGHDTVQARKVLKQLREVTFEQVGEERLLWAENFGN